MKLFDSYNLTQLQYCLSQAEKVKQCQEATPMKEEDKKALVSDHTTPECIAE